MSSEQQVPGVPATMQQSPKKAMWVCIVVAWALFLAPIPGTIFIALPVNLAAIILAIVCIVRGAVGSGIIGLVCTTIGSVACYLIGLALTAGGIAALSSVPPA